MKNSKQSRSMETINPSPNVDQDTRLSGVYIRNLVKQLTTSSSSSSSSTSSSPPPTPPKNRQTPHKKQVRRRLHTTRPYQERLLNMAEARKEIVTALKYHRATMKQQQQQQQLQVGPPSPPPPPALVLPSQTLGLSLGSFQDLTNLDAACLYNNNNNQVGDNATSAVSVFSNISSPLSDHPETVLVVDDQKGVGSEGSRALGDKEMEEIKSIGEMHEMEWNDTMNSATSAWWFKFLHNMEFQQDSETAKCVVDDDDQYVVELPLLWEGGNDQIYSTHANFELPSLKIEDMDDEWLC